MHANDIMADVIDINYINLNIYEILSGIWKTPIWNYLTSSTHKPENQLSCKLPRE